MAQSATTVTPENPTPPTNLSCVGATPPLDPAQAAVDDGWVSPGSNYNVFAAKTAAAGAGTSVDAEGKGNEVLVTQTYSSSIYLPNGPLLTDSCGPAYSPNPNQNHASSLSPATNPTLTSIAPTTSVHGTAAITMTATGTGFTKQSAITIGGVKQATTFVSSTSLTCLATPPAAAGTPAVAVITGGAVITAPQTWTIT
ncbi:MAG TPA: IPT/TIG domain-containing protein [Stellaceae bacterium]|jgi:hypothetical protein|nr:IPT/TIG domain-containing protein [Stellaceae bacterium]